ncbi:MAM and fibronectin type III domain-containing protein 1-like [Orbicella faveolata]|uniref:MAM and fibronectin type III domain-containing protein 1-like n=1 Tax=Orbicella faveolata TaxID=48498 RepID=UPI0009E53B34|nr:MAM and fibronectin type III domain-containing protein 1-like [Orbicella faveolata]
MLVSWDPLPDEFTNGQLIGYIIYLRFYKNEYEWYDDGELGRSVNVSSSETQVILDDLDGGRRYQVSVAAFTVDVGPKSNWETFMVGCEGSFYGHFGEFNVTQWDWEELYCSWTIHNPGLSDPVLYIAAHDVQLRSCE